MIGESAARMPAMSWPIVAPGVPEAGASFASVLDLANDSRACSLLFCFSPVCFDALGGQSISIRLYTHGKSFALGGSGCVFFQTS